MSSIILFFSLILLIAKTKCECVPGCISCDNESPLCDRGKCKEGYLEYHPYCYHIIENCKEQVKEQCKQCFDGYSLNDNRCVMNICSPTELEGGLQYCNNCTSGDERKCLGCVYPYVLSGNNCVIKAKGFTAVQIIFLFLFIIIAIVVGLLFKEDLSK